MRFGTHFFFFLNNGHITESTVFYTVQMFNFGKNSFNFGRKNSETLEYVSFERGTFKQILDICYFLKETE